MEVLQIIAQVVLWIFVVMSLIGSLIGICIGGLKKAKCRVSDGVETIIAILFVTVPLLLLAFGYFI